MQEMLRAFLRLWAFAFRGFFLIPSRKSLRSHAKMIGRFRIADIA
jgi:hypothetical protein